MCHNVLEEAMKLNQEIITHRRWLHANAETGFQLPQTSSYVRTELKKMGYHVRDCGRCGLTATAGHGSPVFLLRADMDALPIREEVQTEFSCTNGNMHACGHDCHTAMLLGAAKLLKQEEHQLNGTVKFMFQPAEETLQGSMDMIRSGILENPKPDAAMMIHMAVGIPVPSGTVIVSPPGLSAPSADYFTIQVQGKGCHGSAPQEGIDALTAAAQILLALQEIPAREMGIHDEAVLTIGTFHAGSASNVIADTAVMGGTVRCFDLNLRQKLKQRIQEICTGIGSAFRTNVQVSFDSGCPPLRNDPELCAKAEIFLKEVLGDKSISVEKLNPNGKPAAGGSEDFAYISQEIPTVMVALAAGESDKGYTYPLHHPKVRFDEGALPYGAAALCAMAMEYLNHG